MSNRHLAPLSLTGSYSPQFRLDAARMATCTDSRSMRPKILCVFGTRPEIIKLAPIIRELKQTHHDFQVMTVMSGQHTDLVEPFLELFQVKPDFNLQIMQRQQTPNEVCARVLAGLEPIMSKEAPEAVIVQGDTTTALAGALTGFHHKTAVAHVEAGLRSGDPHNPFPEEMNRRLISRMATYHFAATSGNRDSLLREGVPADDIFVTGNPVVDSLHYILENTEPSSRVRELLKQTAGQKLLVLTTHRRESFGRAMRQNLRDIREFVERHEDVSLIFAVHPNPNVVEAARTELNGGSRILLIEPLGYSDFIQLLKQSWVVLSDSGGIQEEAPSLGKPVFVLRTNTERPEAIDAGVAFLAGNKPGHLLAMLNRAYDESGWLEKIKQIPNPFGDGKTASRIAEIIQQKICCRAERITR